MELEFEISNQSLVRTDSVGVVNQSVNYLSCVFTFKTTDWSGFNKYVLFKSESGENYCYSLGTECEVECTVPAKVLEHDLFRLTLFGLKDEERITTNLVTVKLVRSGFSTSIQSYDGDGTGDIFSDWVELLSDYLLKSETEGFVLNDGTIDTNTYLTEHQSLENYVTKETGKGLFSGSYNDLTNKPGVATTSSNGFMSSTDKQILDYGKTLLVGVSQNNNSNTIFTASIPSVTTLGHGTVIAVLNNNVTNGANATLKLNNFDAKPIYVGNRKIKADEFPFRSMSLFMYVKWQAFENNNGAWLMLQGADATLVDNLTTNDGTRPLSARQGKFLQDSKISKSDTPGLVKNDGGIDTNSYLTTHQSLDSKTVTVEKQSTAETGYISTYVIKQGGTALTPKINIPKDYLVKSASMGTCSTANSPVNGYTVGDKYLDFVINTRDNSGSDEHLYILVSDLIDTYTGDDSTIVLSNGVFSVKSDVFANKTHTHSDYVNPTIADNLTTNDSTQVLSAKQGKALADLIGSAITYINQ